VKVSHWVLSVLLPCARQLAKNVKGGAMSQLETDRREGAPDFLEVEARTNRRTALVELRGELDLATAPRVAEVLDGLELDAAGVRHVVLDLRGLTFMDASGLHELLRQNDYAHQNRHNLSVVRGRKAIDRLLALTAIEKLLVLVDDPEDLVPPPSEPAI
jgi:anti-sigma B factor antagonist